MTAPPPTYTPQALARIAANPAGFGHVAAYTDEGGTPPHSYHT
jgi:hypothetical protein